MATCQHEPMPEYIDSYGQRQLRCKHCGVALRRATTRTRIQQGAKVEEDKKHARNQRRRLRKRLARG